MWYLLIIRIKSNKFYRPHLPIHQSSNCIFNPLWVRHLHNINLYFWSYFFATCCNFYLHINYTGLVSISSFDSTTPLHLQQLIHKSIWVSKTNSSDYTPSVMKLGITRSKLLIVGKESFLAIWNYDDLPILL